MPKYQATAYIRLSYTDDRSSESDSVTNQRKLIENFIERNPDIQIVSEKIDDGYSGIIFDRPAFKEMMQDITDGRINCVIVKDLSRLGREYIETGRYLRRVFPTYGVRFIAITDNIDTAHEGSGDDLTVSVKNIMNEAYCRDISIKTRTSLDIKRRNGDFVGAFPVYGYMKSEENKNLLVPDPYASRVVQDIFRMRLDGTSALRIATVLNEMGILSPLAYKKNNGFPYAKHGYADKEDCKWSATTIIRILQDETYIGTLVQGKQGTPHYKIKQMEQRPSSEWIRVPDAHEPLIAKQDFELVQRIRRLDTRTSPKQDTVYLFSGVLICGCCGSRMTRKTNQVKGKEYHYYYCPTGKKHGCTNPVMLKESDLPAPEIDATCRAGIYVRLSVEDKHTHTASIETQQLIIARYLEQNPEIIVVQTYIDNGATGTNFHRPGFQQMLSDIEAGLINCVIVKDLSRLGRNVIDTGYYIERYFPMQKVRFIAVNDTFLSQRSLWRCRLFIPILKSIARFCDRYCQSVFVLQRLQQLLKLITALDIRDFQCRYRNLQRLSQYTEQIVFGRSCTGFILRDADVGGFYRKAHSYPQSSLRHPTFQTKATDAFSRTHKAVHCLCSLLRAGWPAFF